MADWQIEWLEKIGIALGSVITALFGKNAWDYFSGKTKAETQHISITSDMSLLEMTDKVAKDYIGLFREATAELIAARSEIRDIKREHELQMKRIEDRYDKAVGLVRKMLTILKQANHDGWEHLENEATEIFLR